VLANGEVALVDKNNGVGQKKWVVRIGDGTTPFVNLPETDYVINDQLSAYALSASVDAIASNLGSAIENKVKVDDKSVETLNVKRINAESYHELVTNGTVDANTIYIVSSDNLNAFGARVENVGNATADTDAVNLGQLKSVSADIDQKIADATGNATEAVESLSVEVTTKIDDLSSEVGTFKETTEASINGINTTLSSLDERLNEHVGEYGTKIGELEERIGDTYNAITDAKQELTDNLKVTVGEGQTDKTGDIKYTLTQGGVSIGDIVVPRDIFVETAVLGEDNKLILKLKDGTEIPVDLDKFIDTYTAKDSNTIDVTVENREISAEVKDGSIVEAKLGDKAVTTTKIADSAVTATQIADKTITMAKLSDTDVFVFDCGGAQ
jgi:hypothetical protein